MVGFFASFLVFKVFSSFSVSEIQLISSEVDCVTALTVFPC